MATLERLLRRAPADGPIAVMLCDSLFLAEETRRRLSALGFAEIVALGPGAGLLSPAAGLSRVEAPVARPGAAAAAVNRLIGWAAGRWFLLIRAGEFPFFPFCEDRGVADLTDFLEGERRRVAAANAADLYSDALARDAAAFTLDETWFDATGWFAFEREGRSVEVYGGLGWRFEELVPPAERRVNRPALFRADPARPIGPDLRFDDPEYDSLSCPWHANPTLALMSVRRAAALARDPRFRGDFRWPGSRRFAWRSDQLMRHGLMEAGQWF